MDSEICSSSSSFSSPSPSTSSSTNSNGTNSSGGSIAVKECIKLFLAKKAVDRSLLKNCITDILTGIATPAQVGGFLVAFREEQMTAELLLACNEGMLLLSSSLPCKVRREGAAVLDIVGTGGDGFNSFNVSTASAFIAASVGVCVAKQGNRSSSGQCGSADFIEALGIPLTLSPESVSELMEEVGFGFLFAQTFHPKMRSVGLLRREVGVPTVFNFIGPLANSASPSHILLGVGNPLIVPLYVDLLQKKEGVQRAYIVRSDEGMDEVSPCGPTTIWIVEKGCETRVERVSPIEDFGMKKLHTLKDILGPTSAGNVEIFKKVLKGEEEGAVLDYILLNVATALVVAGKATSYREGVSLAREAITSGKAATLVNNYIRLAQSRSM